MARRHDEIRGRGADVVAIGTGDARYAGQFVADTEIPYLVLVDDDARAAHAASLTNASWWRLLHPSTWAATRETWRRGYRIHKAGTRVTQLGATFVLGPGNQVRYAHLDPDSTRHAPLDDVLAALA